MKRLIPEILLIASAGMLMQVSAAGLTVTATSGISSQTAAVMWITNSANVLQQTFAIWSSRNSDHLKLWRATSGNNVGVDAVSSATLSSKATFSGTWNLKGANGNIVPNGIYKYWIEICQDGPTPYHAVGSIVIDATSKNKAGVDSSTSTTAITNVNAVYTAPAVTTNSPPVITNPDTVSAKIGSTTVWTAFATDANNDPVTFTFLGQQSWISVSNATLIINPTTTSKNDTVTVTASDGKGGFDTLKLKITVFSPPLTNVPPVFTSPDTVTARIGSTSTWTAQATDANGDAIAFTFSGQPAWSTVSNGTLTMNATSSSKNSAVTVLASDGKGGLDTLSLKITVVNPTVTNSPPAITSPNFVNAPIGSITKWIANATDPNSDSVSFSFKKLPLTPTAWYSFSLDTLIIIPDPTSQSCTTMVIATDSKGAADTLHLRINVVPGAKVINPIDVQKGFKMSFGSMTCSLPSNAGKLLTISLFTCNGVKILNRTVSLETAKDFSFAGLKAGMYLLTIRTQSTNNAYKIIVGK